METNIYDALSLPQSLYCEETAILTQKKNLTRNG